MIRLNRSALALAAALALGLLIALLASRTPASAPRSAPATAFSAVRAQDDVRQVAREPHTIGSAANARVRDYLVDRLGALGFTARVQQARAWESRYGSVSGGQVENVIGVLWGRNPSLPALAIMAHYDAAPGSPGGSDDAAGVASALETARALRARGMPERDVILVLTDGEETGLLGAKAFFEQDPLAAHVGAVVNMDTRGGGGRAYMFETSPGNGALIDLFKRSAVNPTSTSLAVFLYEHMPNGTDFTIPKDRGVIGLNFAFIGRQFDYHAPNSTPESLEPGALQSMGQQALAASAALAFARTLPAKGEDAVYADLFGGPILAYPPVAGWLVLAVGVGIAAFTLARVRRRGGVAWQEVARGLGGALFLLLITGALLSVLRHATGIPGGFVSVRPLLAQFHLYEAALGLGALGALMLTAAAFNGGRARLWAAGLGVVLAALSWPLGHDMVGAVLGVLAAVLAAVSFGSATRPWNAWAGFVVLAVVFAAAAQALAPGIAFLFSWTLLLAGLGGLAASLTDGAFDRPRAGLALAVIGVLGVGWLLYMAHAIALGVGADLPAALAPMAWLAALVLIPLATVTPRPVLIGAAAVGLAGVLVAVIGVRDPMSPRLPRATHVIYISDPAKGLAWRASTLDKLDPWSKGVLQHDGGTVEERVFQAISPQSVWVAKGAAVPVAPAGVAVASVGGLTTVTLSPPPGAERLQLAVRSDAAVTDVRLDGKPARLMDKPKSWSWLVWYGPAGSKPPVLTFRTGGKVEAQAAWFTPGWPGADRLTRPADAMAWGSSDAHVVLAHAG